MPEVPVSPPATLLKKMAAVLKAVDRIKKDAENIHQRYKYASEKAIKEALHKEFAEQKLMMKVEVTNPQIVGSTLFITVGYSFIDLDSGEQMTGTFLGSGHNRDEKGLYAAITGAIKYILTSTFLIPTGDDPERDEAPKSKYIETPKEMPPQPKVLFAPQEKDHPSDPEQSGLIKDAWRKVMERKPDEKTGKLYPPEKHDAMLGKLLMKYCGVGSTKDLTYSQADRFFSLLISKLDEMPTDTAKAAQDVFTPMRQNTTQPTPTAQPEPTGSQGEASPKKARRSPSHS